MTEAKPDQFAAWQRLVAPVLRVEPTEVLAPGFHATARAYDLGKMHLVSASVDPMKYSHTLDHVRLSGIDHWCLSFLKSGFEVNRLGDQVVRLPAGSLHAASLVHPFQGRSGTVDSIRVLLSRDHFSDLSDVLDAVSLRRIDGPLSYVLKEYMLSMELFIRKQQVTDLSLVTESFTQLLSASLRPVAENVAVADLAISAGRFNLARKYIQLNLTSPKLNARSICQALGISRRQLYYLFERYGGVANFIKQRRLAACCRAISDATDHRLISSIAYSYGYVDSALFSRQFHAEFGFSPTEAREAKLTGHVPLDTPPETFSEWLLQVRGTRSHPVEGQGATTLVRKSDPIVARQDA